MKKTSVFISYAHEDEPTAVEIYNFLKTQDCDPWLDKFSLIPGQDWQFEIQRAIENSDIFIACLSNNSVSKMGYVQKELKKALDVLGQFPEGEIYLIPLKIESCKVPSSLSGRHWLDWLTPHSRDDLTRAIQLSISQKQNRNPFSKQISEMVARETENWLATSTYISEQRLEYIFENRKVLSPLLDKQAECIIHSLIVTDMDLKEWENLIGSTDTNVIFDLLKQWRYNVRIRCFLTRVLGKVWHIEQIVHLGNPKQQKKVSIPKSQKGIPEEQLVRLAIYTLYSSNEKTVESAFDILSERQQTAVKIIFEFAEFEKELKILDSFVKVLEKTGQTNFGLLQDRAEKGNEIQQWLIAKTIRKWADSNSSGLLIEMLNCRSTEVVVQVVESIGTRRLQNGKNELIKLYKNSKEPKILRQIAITFGQIRLDEFTEPLKELAQNKDSSVQSAALYSISGLVQRDEEIQLLAKKLEKSSYYSGGGWNSSFPGEEYDFAMRLCQLQANSQIHLLEKVLNNTASTIISNYWADIGEWHWAKDSEHYVYELMSAIANLGTTESQLVIDKFSRNVVPEIERAERREYNK